MEFMATKVSYLSSILMALLHSVHFTGPKRLTLGMLGLGISNNLNGIKCSR